MKIKKSTYRKLLRKIPKRRDWLFLASGALLVICCWLIVTLVGYLQVPVPYTNAGLSAQWMPLTVRQWSKQIDAMGKRYNLDPNLIGIIMTMESGGDAKAVSPDGAVGLMQVTPLTAKDIAKMYLKTPVSSYNLKNPSTNIEFGVAYLAFLRDSLGTTKQGPSWTDTVELIAAGYNGGPGTAVALRDGQGLRDTQPVIYSRDAFNMWRERFIVDSPTLDRWEERGGSSLITAAKTQQPIQ